jgi:hypothetical protein
MFQDSKKTIKNDFFEFQNNENLEKSVIGENEKEVFPFYLQGNEFF